MLVAVLGLGAAVSTTAVESVEQATGWMTHLVTPPLVFGAMLAIYFRECDRRVSIWRTIMFVALCIAAYLLSVLLAFRLSLPSVRSTMNGSGHEPQGVSFTAGFVGAFIVLGAALFLFGPGNVDWRSIGRFFGCALVGGLLGILSLRMYWDFQSQLLLWAIWQTGVGFCVGYLISREQPDPST